MTYEVKGVTIRSISQCVNKNGDSVDGKEKGTGIKDPSKIQAPCLLRKTSYEVYNNQALF